jgi:hypothetical protein
LGLGYNLPKRIELVNVCISENSELDFSWDHAEPWDLG